MNAEQAREMAEKSVIIGQEYQYADIKAAIDKAAREGETEIVWSGRIKDVNKVRLEEEGYIIDNNLISW